MGKDFLRTFDLNTAAISEVITLANAFKQSSKVEDILNKQTVVLYFNKPSTRTRISFETAVAKLGGIPINITAQELQLSRGETIEDTARVISRYAKAFVIRTFAHADVERFAQAASIPVINALTDMHHPLQSLADIMTIQEKCGGWEGKKIAYVGDGNNNVTHSLLEACVLAGMNIAIATPAGYQPREEIVSSAQEIAKTTQSKISITNDPVSAVAQADVVYTDVWLSMGIPEEQRQKRIKDLTPYQVNASLMRHAAAHAIFMHCLPAHRSEEVTAEVIDSAQSVVFDQAENRMYTAMAILYYLLQRKE